MTATTDHALTSIMLGKNCFPQQETFEKTKKLADDGLDWYCAQSAILVNVEGIARFGAMLANNGINPATGERIIEPSTVKAVVTIMSTSGMYDSAGKFTKDYGIPTKSGSSGALLTVIPGIGSLASFSPLLSEEGYSVKGIGMIEKLNKIYLNFNLFYKDQKKIDFQRRAFQSLAETVIAAISASASGDLETLSRLHVKGVDINQGDYDMRRPLHLAA
jgi:hypothetical protein